MTTMPIDNHPLTHRSLQFMGIAVNKLTFKVINIIKSSKSTTLLVALSAGTKNLVHLKILDTSVKMMKTKN